MRILGVVLIVLGLAALVYGGFSWTERNKVIDVGAVEVTTEDEERVPISPIVGGLILAAGVVLVLKGGRREVGAA
jgi:hypothetical protein